MTLSAPYNFIPLSDSVYLPKWHTKVSHDIPFKDGFSGSFDLYITAKTPIFTRDDDTAKDNPTSIQQFLNYEGRPFIKGSSIRGMLREVVKIAAFGKMDTADDQHFAFREFSKESGYLEMMKPVFAGWLTPDKKIIPAKFAKIDYADLRSLQKQRGNNAWQVNLSMPEKYRRWRGSRETFAQIIDGQIDTFASLTDSSQPGAKEGTIVFTGYIQSKKREFFFYDTRPEDKIPVSDEIFERFEKVHRSSQQRPGMDIAGQGPNEQWAYWKALHEAGENIPVFYRIRGGQLVDFGLAMMYRLPSVLGVHGAIANRSADHLDLTSFDLAELLFGYAADKNNQRDSLKGRVTFSHAFLEGSPRPLAPVSAALQTPKASFYPAYLEQGQSAGGLSTWQDKDATIAGRKRYPARGTINPNPTLAERDDLNTRFQPLDEGSRFKSRVYFHNLRPFELAALLWSFNFGGHIDGLVHKLGLAKPYGYGEVALEADFISDTIIPNDPTGKKYTLREFIDLFEAEMNKQIDNWLISKPILYLLSMANPQFGDSKQLVYMAGPGDRGSTDEFQQAKLRGLALPPPDGVEQTRELLKQVFQKRKESERAAELAVWQAYSEQQKAAIVVRSLELESHALRITQYIIHQNDKAQESQLKQVKYRLNLVDERYYPWLSSCFENEEARLALRTALDERYYSRWSKGRQKSSDPVGLSANKLKEYAAWLRPDKEELPESAESAFPAESNLTDEEAKILAEIGDDVGILRNRANNIKTQDFWSAPGLQAVAEKIKTLGKSIEDRRKKRKYERWADKMLKYLEDRIKSLS